MGWKITIIEVDRIRDWHKILSTYRCKESPTSDAKSYALYVALRDPKCGKQIESYRAFCLAPEWKRIDKGKHECVYDILNHYDPYQGSTSTKSYVIRIAKNGE